MQRGSVGAVSQGRREQRRDGGREQQPAARECVRVPGTQVHLSAAQAACPRTCELLFSLARARPPWPAYASNPRLLPATSQVDAA